MKVILHILEKTANRIQLLLQEGIVLCGMKKPDLSYVGRNHQQTGRHREQTGRRESLLAH